jgi:thioredoxin-like negative regulator of GroEL
MKDYKKAAEILKEENSKIVLATVNGEIEKGLTKRFNLPGFPIVKFYKNGTPINYTGKFYC